MLASSYRKLSIEKLVIGSRKSKLALIQTEYIRDQLLAAHPSLSVEIKTFDTKGDQILDKPLSDIGDKGLFTEELERALLSSEIDLAVHSMKDLPSKLNDGLEIGACSKREDPSDVLVLSKHAIETGVLGLDSAKRIASSSLRRKALLKSKYPNLEIVDIRGNLNTRLNKLDDPANDLDGIILAYAGLKRMNLEDRITELLNSDTFPYAVGQGALAVEIASHRDEVKELLEPINSLVDGLVVKGERSFLGTLEGGCQVPIGIFSKLAQQAKPIGDLTAADLESFQVDYLGLVSNLEGSIVLKSTISGKLSDSEQLGRDLAQDLLGQGASEILDSLKAA